MNYLFNQIQGIFTKHREVWPDQSSVNAAKREWLLTMRAEDVISRELIEHGLVRCRKSGYVRPVPAGQFCIWAWESAMEQAGIPSAEQAYSAILAKLQTPGRQLRGVYYHLYTELDWHRVKSSSADQIRKDVEFALGKTVRWWKSGRAFKAPVVEPEKQIEQKPPVFLTQKQNRSRLAGLMEGL
ncbi:MAG: hypothetical protein K6L60_05520 [Oceanobacter sp.]